MLSISTIADCISTRTIIDIVDCRSLIEESLRTDSSHVFTANVLLEQYAQALHTKIPIVCDPSSGIAR